jgi:hypothetical protein
MGNSLSQYLHVYGMPGRRLSEIQKWCGCPWATRISNFTCPPQILVAHHQQIFDEQQQQII